MSKLWGANSRVFRVLFFEILKPIGRLKIRREKGARIVWELVFTKQ